MNKKFIFIFLIFLVILILILLNFEYKDMFSGNNISKSDKKDILNISSYEAEIEMTVYSNKNTNKYVMKQKYLEPDTFYQEVIEPSNIKGLAVTQTGGSTRIENKNLGLETVYDELKGDISNLSLVRFVKEFKNNENNETLDNDKEIIMRTKINSSKNKYQMYQNLYISKDTNLPTKMEILDINKKVTVYILYKEIRLNKLNKESFL